LEVPRIMFNVYNRTVTAHTSQDRLNIVVVVTGGDELDRISCGLGSLESESGDNFDGRRSDLEVEIMNELEVGLQPNSL